MEGVRDRGTEGLRDKGRKKRKVKKRKKRKKERKGKKIVKRLYWLSFGLHTHRFTCTCHTMVT